MSTLEGTDWVLVYMDNYHGADYAYKCAVSNLKEKLWPRTYMLVNRGSTSYKISGYARDIKDAIDDGDWVLVNRGSTSYKVSGADFKRELGPNKSEVFGQTHYYGNDSVTTVSTGLLSADRSLAIVRSMGATDNYFSFAGFYNSPSGVAYDEKFLHSPAELGDLREFTDYVNPSWSNGFVLLGGDSSDGLQRQQSMNATGIGYTGTHLNASAGFMDWANYTGNSSSQRIYHDLGEVPGAILIFPTSTGWAQYVAWHNKSPNHVHVVGPSSSNDRDSSDDSYGQAGSKLYSSLSGSPIGSVTSTYIDLNNNKYSNFNNSQYSVVFFAGGGSGSELIKCGQYTGTGSSLTLTMDFAPSFFFQWKADTNDNGAAYYGGNRNVAIKSDVANNLMAYPFEKVSQYNAAVGLNGNLLDAWQSNGVMIADDSYYQGWNANGIKYNYIAI